MTKIVIGRRTIEETADAIPCPFCGSEKLGIGSRDAGGGYSIYYGYCESCGAHGPETRDYNSATQIKLAVELWNRRRGVL